ncbi:growth arrest and DNA damage-inducible protein GADD45 alpha-like isoform X2 [Dreissena polymorpha]|nr:growth arrest and DNA damage-inducible protein GADD45 alpha-like isoform X2 [Dreissena polymorpha]
MGQLIVQVVKSALSQGRVTFGLFECVEVLEMCPDQVMVCLLPKVQDSSFLNLINIQHKLIEAHCWENEVNLVKVDSASKLLKLLNDGSPVCIDRTADLSCLLVGYPTDGMTTEDLQVTKLSHLLQDGYDTIALPD